ncbi:35707_t:CDS:2, partial [Racocetra persica]
VALGSKTLLTIGFVSADILYAWSRNLYNEYLLYKTVENGNVPSLGVREDLIVPRSQAVESLVKIFQPNYYHKNYHVIAGEPGTGKTTLSRIAARKAGRGVIYVDVRVDLNNLDDLGYDLGKAINFKECISLTGQLMRNIMGSDSTQFENSKWGMLWMLLSVLLLQIIDILQEYAKESADMLEFVVVFVTNEGSVPERMRERSAWSRASKPVVEIGDVTEYKAIDFLVNRRKLHYAAKDIQNKLSFEDIKQNIFTGINMQFRAAKINPGKPNHEKAKPLLKALLENNDKGLSITYFKKWLKTIHCWIS